MSEMRQLNAWDTKTIEDISTVKVDVSDIKMILQAANLNFRTGPSSNIAANGGSQANIHEDVASTGEPVPAVISGEFQSESVRLMDNGESHRRQNQTFAKGAAGRMTGHQLSGNNPNRRVSISKGFTVHNETHAEQ